VTEGIPAPGFVTGTIVAAPAEVEVVGPESVLRQVTQATTEAVNVEGARARVRDSVTIGLAGDTTARLVAARAAVVTVEVLPVPIERSVPGVVPAVRHLGHDLRAQLSPATVAVLVKGPGNLVRQLSPLAVPTYVDVDGLAKGQYNLPVNFDEVADYSMASVTPATVHVTIR
jgi:YbbR domain-containing protein